MSEPHIDLDNSPHAWKNGVYVSMYHLLPIWRILAPKIRVCHEMLRVFRYINVLTCVIYNCMHSTEQQGLLELHVLVSAVIFIDKDTYM